MEEIILDNLEARVSTEHKTEVEIAFSLLDKFYEEDITQDFIDHLSREDEDHKENIQDGFFAILDDKIRFIFNQHKLTISTEARLSEKNQLLSSLYRIQNLEDYQEIEPILQSERAADEMIADMFSLYCELEAPHILSILDSVADELINLIKIMVDDKSRFGEDTPTVTYDPKLVEALRVFRKHGGAEAIGFKLIEGGFPIGLKLQRYLPFVQEHLHSVIDDKELLLDVYSLILVSEGGFDSPQLFFRDNAHFFTTDTNKITKLDVGVVQLFSELSKLIATGEDNEQS